jgi:hypothetical protein
MSKILFTEDFIVISKSLKEIKKELITYKGDDFECKFIENQHKVYSKKSIGTMQINGLATNPICSNLQFIEKSNETEIKIKSCFRYEYLIITLAYLIISIVLLIKNFELKLLFLPVLFIITFLWFKMIYQNQEKELHSKIKKFLSSL